MSSCGCHSFAVSTKRYRRLLQEHKAAEREREKKRDRSQRLRSEDGGSAALRKRKRRAEQAAAEATAASEQLPRVRCSFSIAPDTGGRVQLLVQPFYKWVADYLPKRGPEAWQPSADFTWSVRWNELRGCGRARTRTRPHAHVCIFC